MSPQGPVAPGQLYASVRAFAGEEMTLKEFRRVLVPLRSETLQVAATVLGLRAAVMDSHTERLRLGRAICLARAAKTRCLC